MLQSILQAVRVICMLLASFMVLMILTLGIHPGALHAASEEELRPADEERIRAIDRCAEAMYQHALSGDIREARLELARLERLVTQTRFERVANIEGLEAFTSAILEAKRSFHAVQPSIDDHSAAISVRLAADALSHRTHPLWYRYRTALNEDIARIRNAYQTNNKAALTESLAELEHHYTIIRPAVLIHREPYIVERLDSLFTFIRNRIEDGGIRDQALLRGLVQLKELTDELFEERDRPTLLPILPVHNPWYWSVLVSAVIVAVLGYSGWLRYRSERDYHLVKRTGGGPI